MLKNIFRIAITALIVSAAAQMCVWADAPYEPGNYVDVIETSDIWSTYFRNKNDKAGTGSSIDNLDVRNWYQTDLPGAKDSAVNLAGTAATSEGIYSGNTNLFINPFIPGDTFMARPHGGDITADLNAKNSIAIGWTAPYDGTWNVDVGLYNRMIATGQGEIAGFALAKKPAGSNKAERLMDTQKVSRPTSQDAPTYGEKEMTVDANEGDTIFLFVINTTGSVNIATNVRYRITDANRPEITYDASKMAQNMLADSEGALSPFDFGLSAAAELSVSDVLRTSIKDANPATLYADNGYVWAGNENNKEEGTVFYLDKNTKKITLKPGTVDGSGKRIPLVAFTVPEDGDYRIDLTARNVAANPSDGGWFYLYKLGNSFHTSALSGGHYDPSEYKLAMDSGADEVVWKKSFIGLKKGEKLIFEACADNAEDKLYEMGLSVEKMVRVKYAYSIGETPVTSFGQVAEAAGKTLHVRCDFLNTDEDFSGGMLILAIYDADGYMVSAKASEVQSFASDDYTVFTASAVIPEGIHGGTVKAFMIDDMNHIRQVTESDVLGE